MNDVWGNAPFQHVGAMFAELEFQHYQPRHKLTNLLNEYDIIQIVAGSSAWAKAWGLKYEGCYAQ